MDFIYNSEVDIPVGRVHLKGNLVIPFKSKGLVIFSHGAGSSRLSPRNQQVAAALHTHQLGTLLFDLLTAEEDRQYHNRFDIPLLSKRLIGVTRWVQKLQEAKDLPIGYFGASTGAAAALMAAAMVTEVEAVVSRGGRPDLAIDFLPEVNAAVLFIVGSLDYDVLELNRQALVPLNGEKKLEIVPGAGHLFEETGMMNQVILLARAWFDKYLGMGVKAALHK